MIAGLLALFCVYSTDSGFADKNWLNTPDKIWSRSPDANNIITFSENGEKMFAMALVSCVILFAGIVSPKLPYTKHTGLRLPWTVQDEDTWNIAHKIIGYISFPVVLLYIACTLTISNFEIVTLCTMIVWIGIPGGISYIHFFKKYHGTLE